MLHPLFLMALAFQLFFFAILIARMKVALLAARSRVVLFNRLQAQAGVASRRPPVDRPRPGKELVEKMEPL
jgi:hypothetical protein